MNNFVDTADSRSTSPEIMEAILFVAGSETEADRVWADPSYEESLAIWERVTGNGLRDSAQYRWGANGSEWAAAAGLEG